MELITGKKGSAHITPEQDAAYNKALTGYSNCVFYNVSSTGELSAPTASTSSALVVQINELQAMVCGRRVCVEGTDTVTLSGGAGSGMKRYDYIAAKVIKNTDGTQTAEWEIIPGDAAETPAPPDWTPGDLSTDTEADYPIFLVTVGPTAITEISLCGTLVGAIGEMSKTFTKTIEGYPWKSWRTANVLDVTLNRSGNVVTCYLHGIIAPQETSATLSECSVPAGYRPNASVYMFCPNVQNAVMVENEHTQWSLPAASGTSACKWNFLTSGGTATSDIVEYNCSASWITEDDYPS